MQEVDTGVFDIFFRKENQIVFGVGSWAAIETIRMEKKNKTFIVTGNERIVLFTTVDGHRGWGEGNK